jgi:hypothetical protein
LRKDQAITLNQESIDELASLRLNALFEADGRYASLAPRDVVPIANAKAGSGVSHVQVMHKESAPAGSYIAKQVDSYATRAGMRHQLGRDIKDDEVINVFEITVVSDYALAAILGER